MLRKTLFALPAAIAILGGAVYAAAQGGDAVRFPERYRSWAMVKGRLVGPNSRDFATGGGFRYVYANRTGIDGYAKRSFADGTILVDERIEVTEDADGIFQEGRTLHVGVMTKDSRHCAETGGWCFDFFVGDDRSTGIPHTARKACFTQCHSKQVDTDFVFSTFRKPVDGGIH